MKYEYMLDRPWPHFGGSPDGLISDYISDITDKEIKERYSGFIGFIKRGLGAFRLYKKPVKDKEKIYSEVSSAFFNAIHDTSEVELGYYNGGDCFMIEAKNGKRANEKFNKFTSNLEKKLADILSISKKSRPYMTMNLSVYEKNENSKKYDSISELIFRKFPKTKIKK